ncbi:uncharacterized protein LOC17891576 isoform X2 [Capsella rubella]|uniref:uncharacterized protein LOC17891576 isoform X2 n=1 Tax=Capsella rubella TaxID=81985 RepID=UPI000CD4F5B1|nr:uncharacterized protein LOC17891576 isoform X2 [Capsella rubella]
MEPTDSSPPRDTSEQNPMPSPNGKTETWVKDFKRIAIDLDLGERLSSKIRETASSIFDFSLQWEEYDKEMELKDKLFMERFVELKKKEERVKLVEERERKVELTEASISQRLSALEEKENECDMKQFLGENVMRAIQEEHGELMRGFHARENELRLLDETIREKSKDLEKKEVDFQLKQHAETREIEHRREFLELKEKQLEEREKLLELKQRQVDERSTNAETCKRSWVESVSTKEGRDSESLIPPGKKQKSITELYHAGEEKNALHIKISSSLASATDSEHTSEAKRREAYGIACIDEPDEDPEPFTCPDPDFNDFNNKISSFALRQIWALYDPIDDMPRYYAQIRGITYKPDLSLRVKWLESVQTTENEVPIPIACGRFIYGKTEKKSQFMFSHKMNPITRGQHVTINPRKGETWALFTDWTETWNCHREQHKPPYKYEFVEVLSEFDSDHGIGVAYLGRVEGFTSVYKHASRHGFVKVMIQADEMLRFSHRVPSIEMTGHEKEGVPAGSFELDPAAIPQAYLKAAKVEEEKIRKMHGTGSVYSLEPILKQL